MLLATRISVTSSIHSLLKRTQRSLSSPKQFLSKSSACRLRSTSFSFCTHTLHKSTSAAPSLSYSCSSLSASSMAAAAAADPPPIGVNPLLQDFEFPPFDVVEAKHVCPGIRALLKKLVCIFLLVLPILLWFFGFYLLFFVSLVFFLLCLWALGSLSSVQVSEFLVSTENCLWFRLFCYVLDHFPGFTWFFDLFRGLVTEI